MLASSTNYEAPAEHAPAVKPARAFKWDNYSTHKVALRLAYHGHIYDGLAKQVETANTVEGVLVEALTRLRLIPLTGPADFARCGRTDKGVSALGNVVSLTIRASVKPTPPVSAKSATSNNSNSSSDLTSQNEAQRPAVACALDYANMLNHVLPPTIRVVGHARVPPSFDARFSCTSRTYRYYFCHVGLNMAAMQQAAQYMLGTHNFRNLCKTDVIHVNNFVRHVTAVSIVPSPLLPDSISYLEITANSFLYHQIRCTMTVLLLVGRGLEEPSVVRALLERGDAKPHYPLADAGPLVLWCCSFHHRAAPMCGNETGTQGSSACAHEEGCAPPHRAEEDKDSALINSNGEPDWQLSSRALLFIEQELHDIATALLLRAASAEAMRRQLFIWYAAAADADANADAGTECDEWSITGRDWTESRTHGAMRARRRDLHERMQRRTRRVLHQRVDSPCTAESSRHEQHDNKEEEQHDTHAENPCNSHGYVKLLDRSCERTYEEEVRVLAGKKRERYDRNAAKKTMAEALCLAAAKRA